MAVQPRRNHPAVVGHQQIARPQIVDDVGEAAVLQQAAVALHHQQPRRIARLHRRLRDQLGGEGW
jgi:hypothetical protein